MVGILHVSLTYSSLLLPTPMHKLGSVKTQNGMSLSATNAFIADRCYAMEET